MCRLPQRKVTPSEKDKTISEVILSTSEKNKTTSEENVARSLGDEEGGHFLSSGVRVLPFEAVPGFRNCAGLSPKSVKSVLKSGTSGAFGWRDVYIFVRGICKRKLKTTEMELRRGTSISVREHREEKNLRPGVP